MSLCHLSLGYFYFFFLQYIKFVMSLRLFVLLLFPSHHLTNKTIFLSPLTWKEMFPLLQGMSEDINRSPHCTFFTCHSHRGHQEYEQSNVICNKLVGYLCLSRSKRQAQHQTRGYHPMSPRFSAYILRSSAVSSSLLCTAQ